MWLLISAQFTNLNPSHSPCCRINIHFTSYSTSIQNVLLSQIRIVFPSVFILTYLLTHFEWVYSCSMRLWISPCGQISINWINCNLLCVLSVCSKIKLKKEKNMAQEVLAATKREHVQNHVYYHSASWVIWLQVAQKMSSSCSAMHISSSLALICRLRIDARSRIITLHMTCAHMRLRSPRRLWLDRAASPRLFTLI